MSDSDSSVCLTGECIITYNIYMRCLLGIIQPWLGVGFQENMKILCLFSWIGIPMKRSSWASKPVIPPVLFTIRKTIWWGGCLFHCCLLVLAYNKVAFSYDHRIIQVKRHLRRLLVQHPAQSMVSFSVKPDLSWLYPFRPSKPPRMGNRMHSPSG